MRSLVAIFCIAALAGCGGGGSNGPNFPPLGTAVTRANVKVIPQIDTVETTIVDADTIRLTGDGVPALAVGDVLVSQEGEGLLRKVTAVREIDGGVEVDTEQGSFQDVFQEANVKIKDPVSFTGIPLESPVEGVTVGLESRGRGVDDVIVFGLDNLNLILKNELDEQFRVVLSGSVKASADDIFDVQIEEDGLIRARQGTEVSLTQNLRIRGSLKGSLFRTDDLKIYEHEFEPIVKFIGQVPIVITRKMQIVLNFKITGEFGAEVGATGTFRVRAVNSFVGTATQGFVEDVERDFDFDVDIDPKLTAFASMAAEFNVPRVDFDFKLYGAVGPRFKVGVGSARLNFKTKVDATPGDGVVPGDITLVPEWTPKLDVELRLSEFFQQKKPIAEVRVVETTVPLGEIVIRGGDLEGVIR